MAQWGPFDLTGKNAIVTGGAMGIGFGIARRYIEAGANVLIGDLNSAAAQGAVTKLAGGPGRAISMAADVSDVETGPALVNRCVEEFGSLDIFVNNAGIYPQSPMLEMTSALFDKVYQINLRGLAFCSKAAAARMVAQGKGGNHCNKEWHTRNNR